jgi:hypothetical protein
MDSLAAVPIIERVAVPRIDHRQRESYKAVRGNALTCAILIHAARPFV